MTEQIAIIGMGCRFPAAPDLQAFWQLMCNGVDAITEVPANRFDINALYNPRPATPGKIMSRWGGFLEQVDQFDPAFFGISPREATRMDPQHRLLLEVAWEAMEDAGQVPEKLSDTLAGVFMGVITSDYWDRQFRNPVDLDVYSTTGSARSGAAGRISYALGLQGISVAVDAACSSSLVAVHLACQSLRTGSCTLALAGGVNIILNPDHAIGYSQGKMMAPDGHCKTFDAQANGYVRSEGAGIVVLKPLSLALADGDTIYAVIRGSAANNDGHSDLFMTPSVKGQQAVLKQAYSDAGINPGSVQYVETHGTGTSVGDPVELKALGSVLAENRPSDHPCIVGSVKTNIGHTEGAAGLAGLIKVALCLKHKAIPPNLHFHNPNPAIPWQELPLVVAQKLQAWPESNYPHLAGVSSFGIAGTNAHIVVEEAPVLPVKAEWVPCDSAYLLTLSAHTTKALDELVQRYQTFISAQNTTDLSLHDICYTASARKTHQDQRLAIVGHSIAEVDSKLEAFLRGETNADIVMGRTATTGSNKIAWIFPGQGSQWLGMGCALLKQEPVFRETLEQCDLVMRQYINWSLLAQLQAEQDQSRLDQVNVVQPLIFAIQISLAALWRSWGIEPDAVVGHSMGEVAAAYVAGALTLDDAAWIICGRSNLLRRTSGQGAMAAVELSFEQARLVVSDYKDRVSIAVSNSPGSTVLSGDPAALAEILATLERNGVFGRLVNVNVASHSPQMDPLRDDLLDLLAHIQPAPSTIPIYSTVTGKVTNGAEFDAHYWVQNLREPVLFLHTVQQLLNDDFDTFLEISPHPLLVGAMKQTIQHAGSTGTVLASLRREEDEQTALLRTLGALYTQGYVIPWDRLYPTGGRHVSLPTYPWQRERFWNTHLEGAAMYSHQSYPGQSNANTPTHPMLGPGLQPALQADTYLWETTLDAKRFPYLRDHCIHGMVVLPSTGYVEMALAAATEVFGSGQFSLENIALKKALFFPQDSAQKVQIVLTRGEDKNANLQIYCSQADNEKHSPSWLLYASADICLETAQAAPQHMSPQQAQQQWTYTNSATEHYQGLRSRGIEHGPLFQGVTHIWQHKKEAMAQITIPEALMSELHLYQFHPALLDICLQGIMSLLPEDMEEDTYVPVIIKKVNLYRQPAPDSQLWSHTLIRSHENTGMIEGDISLLDENGQTILEVLGFCLQPLEGMTQQAKEDKLNKLLYTLRWEEAGGIEPIDVVEHRKHWLIFSEQDGVGQVLAAHLQAHGASCVIVHPGRTYKRLNARHYEIDHASPASFTQLLADAFDSRTHPCHDIVYLWGMNTSSTDTATLHSLENDQKIGSVAALHLVQAVTTAKWETLPRLWLVTCGAQATSATDQVVSLSQASLWGFGRVVAYEHEELHCALIDMDPAYTPRSIAALFKEVWTDDSDDQIALRGDKRFVARLVRHKLQAEQDTSSPVNETTIFRSDSTYLITGGLGGIGLKVAHWMIKQGAKYLVLVGRSGASEAAREAISSMKEAGAQIKVIKADITVKQHAMGILADIQQSMPPLRGILHSAVVLDDGTLLQLNQERFLSVMRPKIAGAWNLHELSLDQPLDFFVMFSSAASLIGSPGQGNYAAANAFMDALAHYRVARGYPALSINWGRWAEVGQAIRQDRSKRLDFRGFTGMKPEDALLILGRLLQQNEPQVGVMSFNLRKWSQFYPELGQSEFYNHLIQEEANTQTKGKDIGNSHLTREILLSMDREQHRQVTETYLSEQIGKVLGLSTSRLDAHQQLNRLGIDSLMSVELKNRIDSDLSVTVPVATFLQGITLDQLTTQILQHI